ncbi:MAG TPA: hypothetical protein VFS08_13990 [Gemmatimonadaceae bacterium]|nr:hypothetical protein [Gemmatimonadaceae bacterium]
MSTAPLPPVPWQFTGNHWVTLPCIHPADGGIHAVGVLHRGSRAAVEFAGSADFLAGTGPALARPFVEIAGVRHELSAQGMAWELVVNWLPTFACTAGDLVVRGTIFAPYGRDADMAGAVYLLTFENRGGAGIELACGLEGTLGHRQQRIRTARPFVDAHRVARAGDGALLLHGAALPGAMALALTADEPGELTLEEGERPRYALRRALTVPAGQRAEVAFYLAAGPERDGAESAVAALRRRGWRAMLSATREAVLSLEQSTGHEGTDRLVNRNLLFAYFYAVGRALDDAHFYLVRSRAPWNGHGVTYRDWDALMWTLPAVQLADPGLARELLLRVCELHGYAPGRGDNYLDGTLFAPGFSLEGAAAYPIAIDRYIRGTGDDELVDEAAIADTLYVAADDLAARRDKRAPLFATEVDPAGAPVEHAYTLHGNAVAAQALDVLRRTLDEEAARDVEDPDAVRAALRRHFVVEREGKERFAASATLAGERSSADSPVASALWLPLYDAVTRDDSVYRRTARDIALAPESLVQRCARLVGPEAEGALRWLRNAPLDRGVAAAVVDEDGRAVADGGDAALAGLVAYSAWYAVHALGVRP